VVNAVKWAGGDNMGESSEVTLKCVGCGKIYILGKDAIVVSAAAALGGFKGVTVIGTNSNITNTRDAPDLVDSLVQRSWSSLEPEIEKQQQVEIRRILRSILGRKQWWKCRKCNTVQSYT
jgi:hypothetical protein